MTLNRKILIAKFATILATIPAVIVASSAGAPPQHTGAPGEQTCAQSGCHVGTPVNGGGGRVEVTYSGGTNYTPGQRGTFTVTITDSTARAFGFQASVRTADGANPGQAGTLQGGTGVQVICADDRTPPCRDTAPVQYATHTAPRNAGSFTFDWTPPAQASGDIRVYVAGNAANGNGTNTGDRIYTANITLSPAVGGGANRPSISQGGVTDAFNFQEGLAENSWVALFGRNLAPETRTWDGTPELAAGRLPTTLAGVSVTVNGKPAAVYAVTPTQVNILAPLDTASGDVQVVLRNASGESTPVTARKVSLTPGLYAPFAQEGRLFVTGRLNADASILGKPGVDPRSTRAFRPGDVVQLYANSLGATNPTVPENQFVTAPLPVANSPTLRIGDTSVEVLGAAMVSSGFYQINVRIPDLQSGDYPIVVTTNSVSSASNVYITVQR